MELKDKNWDLVVACIESTEWAFLLLYRISYVYLDKFCILLLLKIDKSIKDRIPLSFNSNN